MLDCYAIIQSFNANWIQLADLLPGRINYSIQMQLEFYRRVSNEKLLYVLFYNFNKDVRSLKVEVFTRLLKMIIGPIYKRYLDINSVIFVFKKFNKQI
jgi:hypothetical protein